jgi:comEA protein
VVVDVVGAVRQPGLYRLPQGSRIADAVARAGGATGKAQLAQVNLAAPLADGEQIVVPKQGALGAVAPSGAGAGAGTGPAAPVQLSTATLEQLETLPGIGPVMAQKILDYRTKHGAFSSVDELDAVSGSALADGSASGPGCAMTPVEPRRTSSQRRSAGLAFANLARGCGRSRCGRGSRLRRDAATGERTV